MVINGPMLLDLAPIKNMVPTKLREHGVSYGLSEVGYDIRLKQHINFCDEYVYVGDLRENYETFDGRFCIASAIEEFQMPTNLVGVVHDKSTWARRGISVFNTVIEPGWKGFLTLELVYHGRNDLIIPAGSGIAQVIFSEITYPSQYNGKYQDQADEPVHSKFE